MWINKAGKAVRNAITDGINKATLKPPQWVKISKKVQLYGRSHTVNLGKQFLNFTLYIFWFKNKPLCLFYFIGTTPLPLKIPALIRVCLLFLFTFFRLQFFCLHFFSTNFSKSRSFYVFLKWSRKLFQNISFFWNIET